MVARRNEAEQHSSGQDQVRERPSELRTRPSEWLPADWVETAVEDAGANVDVIEIQPGVRWLPREGHVTRLVEAAPVEKIAVPRLRWRRISWPHRRQLLAVAATAVALATPFILGGLGSKLARTAPQPAARSPFAPALATPAPGLHGGSGGKPTAASVRTGALVARTAHGATAAPGAHGLLASSSSPSQPPSPGSGSQTAPSTGVPSGPGNSGSAPAGGGGSGSGGGSSLGGGSSSSTGGGSTSGGGSGTSAGGGGSSSAGGGGSAPQGGGSPSSPPQQSSPLAPAQNVVSSAPSTVQSVASGAPKLLP